MVVGLGAKGFQLLFNSCSISASNSGFTVAMHVVTAVRNEVKKVVTGLAKKGDEIRR